jgi:3-oxosteroid 1-dehydrogenase
MASNPLEHPMWTTDLLVVGSGAGALTSAVTAAELGLDVLVIEKGHLWGGTSASSGGTLWIPCTRHMTAAGVDDSPEEAFEYLHNLIGDEVPESKLRAYIANASKMLHFLEDTCGARFRAVKYADYHMDLPGAKENRSHEPLPLSAGQLGRHYSTLQPMHQAAQAFGRVNWTIGEARPMITRRPGWAWTMFKVMARYYLDLPQRYRTTKDRRLTAGNSLLGQLRRALNERKVPLRLGVALEELIIENGQVVGARVNYAGQVQTIRANRGVVLAAGGFERNQAMREANLAGDGRTPTSAQWSGSQGNNTGDAISAAALAGAKLEFMDSAWWAPSIRLGDEDRARPMFVERALPGCMIVNQQGVRYMNESASYHIAGGEMMRLHSADCSTIPSWFVFDARYRGQYNVGPLLPGPPSTDRMVKASMRDIMKRGDTVAELADEIGVDASVLERTFARFNEHAARGEDPDFHRGVNGYDRYYGDPRNEPNPCLAALTKAPFYAVKIFPGDIGTKGGVLTDDNGCALSESGAPIKGLYAIGNTSASVMGRTYPGAGSTLGPAMTFGYLAAHHAAQC